MILQLSIETIEQIVMILYGVLAGLLLIFGTDLLKRYFQADKQTRGDAANLIFFSIGSAVTLYFFYMIIATFNYFFTTPDTTPDWAYPAQIFVFMLTVALIAAIVESIIFSKRKLLSIGKVRFGLLGLIAFLAVLYALILLIINIVDTDNLGMVYEYFIVYIAMIVYGAIAFIGIVQILFRRLNPQKEIKRKILWGLLFAIIALIGGIIQRMGRDSILDEGPVELHILWVYGILIEIFGWIIVREYFLSVPSYSELEWRNGIIELHVIMAETGISLYYKSFKEVDKAKLKGDLEVTINIDEKDRPNADLVGGGMIGIRGMLSEIAGTKGKLSNIQIGEKHLMFNQAEVAMVLLLADKNLGVYHSILHKLVREIEEIHPDLKDFNGDTRKINIGPIVEKYFGSNNQKEKKK